MLDGMAEHQGCRYLSKKIACKSNDIVEGG